MTDANLENLNSPNEEDVGTSLEDVNNEANESPEDKIARLTEQNTKLFERAKKAEGFVKVDGQWVKKPKNQPEAEQTIEQNHTGLSPKDYLALTENGVKADEYDRVLELATLLKKPVSETLKDKTAQSILKSEREERATANATAVSAKARKSGKSNKEIVLENFASGRIPETEEEQKSLAEAQFEQLLNKGK